MGTDMDMQGIKNSLFAMIVVYALTALASVIGFFQAHPRHITRSKKRDALDAIAAVMALCWAIDLLWKLP